jgi:hypothetical protein
MSTLTTFQADIKNILEQARNQARSAVNAAMVEAYWLIGRRIVEEEQHGQHKAEYGARLIEDLSTALMADFGKGFSYANLYNCRQFYLTFPDQAILYTACRDLSWSHLRLIIRVDSSQAIADDLCGAMNANYAVNKALQAFKHCVMNLKLNSYLNLTKV